jgi:hypothetical protein
MAKNHKTVALHGVDNCEAVESWELGSAIRFQRSAISSRDEWGGPALV